MTEGTSAPNVQAISFGFGTWPPGGRLTPFTGGPGRRGSTPAEDFDACLPAGCSGPGMCAAFCRAPAEVQPGHGSGTHKSANRAEHDVRAAQAGAGARLA